MSGTLNPTSFVIEPVFSILETVGPHANEPDEKPLFKVLFEARPSHPESPVTETP